MTEQLSPDGFYRWDGSQWVPSGKVPTAAPTGIRTIAGAAPAMEVGLPAAQPLATGYGPSHQSPHGVAGQTAKKKMAIEAFGLKKHFGKQKVLDGVDMGIPESEVTMIMGPSGTGKSVFLRHVVGLMFPDAGDIKVAGHSVPSLSSEGLLELRRNVGMLFQDGPLFSSMNLYDNVAFPLRQHTKKSEKEIKEIVMQRLEGVGLSEAVTKMPNELSGGMRKRAGFARALVLEPELLLFDEPDSGLDPVRTALLCDLIKKIQQKYKSKIGRA